MNFTAPTVQMAQCQPGTWPLGCQNPSTVLLVCTFLVSPPDSRRSRAGSLPAAACPGGERQPEWFGCGGDLPSRRHAGTCRGVPRSRSLQLAPESWPQAWCGGGGCVGSPLLCPSPPATTGDLVTADRAGEGAKGTTLQALRGHPENRGLIPAQSLCYIPHLDTDNHSSLCANPGWQSCGQNNV